MTDRSAKGVVAHAGVDLEGEVVAMFRRHRYAVARCTVPVVSKEVPSHGGVGRRHRHHHNSADPNYVFRVSVDVLVDVKLSYANKVQPKAGLM
jgi:hypothetical protein